jgi:integrase
MVALCRSRDDLHWLVPVIVALACAGLRISELSSLLFTDIDFGTNVIRIVDESMQAKGNSRGKPRETKNSRNRSFPIHPVLREALERIKPTRDGLVFHGPLNGKLKPDTVRTILIREVLNALSKKFPSLPGQTRFRDGRLHSFRHYSCSRCAHTKKKRTRTGCHALARSPTKRHGETLFSLAQ